DDRAVYLDAVDGTEIRVPGAYQRERNDIVLVQLDRAWAALDLATRRLTTLAGAAGALDNDYFGMAPGVFRIGDALYDLPTARRVGGKDDEVVLVDPAGRTLLAPTLPPSVETPPGPLRWAP